MLSGRFTLFQHFNSDQKILSLDGHVGKSLIDEMKPIRVSKPETPALQQTCIALNTTFIIHSAVNIQVQCIMYCIVSITDLSSFADHDQGQQEEVKSEINISVSMYILIPCVVKVNFYIVKLFAPSGRQTCNQCEFIPQEKKVWKFPSDPNWFQMDPVYKIPR